MLLTPLNGLQINSFLDHLPQGRHLAEALDGGTDALGYVVELGLGGESADGNSQAGVGQLVVEAHRAQHVGGLEAGRGAGGARGHRDVLEAHEQGLALDVGEGHVEGARQARVQAAVDDGVWNRLGERGLQVQAQLGDASGLGGHRLARQSGRFALRRGQVVLELIGLVQHGRHRLSKRGGAGPAEKLSEFSAALREDRGAPQNKEAVLPWRVRP